MYKSRKFTLKHLAMAALLLMPMPFAPVNNSSVQADTIAVNSAPVLISGIVKQYYTNRAGYVSALSLDTSAGIEMVHFAPSWAKRLLASSPVGAPLDGWVTTHRDAQWSWNNLVSIGKDPATRFLTEPTSTGVQQLDDRSWIWKKGVTGTVNGKLKKIIVNEKGDVLALVLDNDALIKVPLTVRNEELGAYGTEAIAPLFKDVEVTAWGTPEWQASGNVSIYSQHLATTGLSINGKTVSAIGIPRISVNEPFVSQSNINLIDASPAEIVGADGEYASFGNEMLRIPATNTFIGSPQGAHLGHAMLQTVNGDYYPVVHEGIQVFALIHKNAVELPLVNGTYLSPFNMLGSKLVMVMDDGRQYEMSSSDGNLYVDLPDGNQSPVNL